MLIEELNLATVDPLGDLLSDLVRAPSLNHVQASPAVLRLRAGGGAHEEGVLELALQVVLLDVVCQGRWDFSTQTARLAMPCFQMTVKINTYLGYPTPVKPDQPI